jgi:WD40 repeat protein
MKPILKTSLIMAGIIAVGFTGPVSSAVAQVNAPRVTNTSAHNLSPVSTPILAAPNDVASSSNETLVIRSFPVGLKAYVVPKNVAEGMLGTVELTAEEYFVGRTPVELDLEPGEYRVTVELDESINFRQDGEVSVLYVLTDVGEMAPIAKIYALDKLPDKQAYITALFWPEEMPLAEFVTSLPKEQLFPLVDEAFFVESFADYGIPSQDSPFLLAMLSQTGKAIWYSSDSSRHVFVYFTAPDSISMVPPPPSLLPPPAAEPMPTPEPTETLPTPPVNENEGAEPSQPESVNALIPEYKLDAPPYGQLTFSPDGSILAVCHPSSEGVAQFRDMRTGQVIASLEDDTWKTFTAAAFSPDGTIWALGDHIGDVHLFDARSGNKIAFMEDLANESYQSIERIVFSPDGRLLATSDMLRVIRLWDIASGEVYAVLSEETNGWDIGFSADGSRLVSASVDAVTVWDAKTGEQIERRAGEFSYPALSPQGDLLAYMDVIGESVQIRNVFTWEDVAGLESDFQGELHGVARMALGPGGSVLVTVHWDGTIRLWDVTTGAVLGKLEKLPQGVEFWALAFSPDGTWLAGGGRDAKLRIWRLNVASEPTRACNWDVAAPLSEVYFGDELISQQLGCPIINERALYMVFQPFERGQMYRRDTREIIALQDDGGLLWGMDEWQEGMPIDDPSLVPPPGLLQPTRGLGLFWRTTGTLRDMVGWAIAPETTIATIWQDFEHGVMFLDADGHAHVLLTSEARHFLPGASAPTEDVEATPTPSAASNQRDLIPVSPPQPILDREGDVAPAYIDVVGFSVSLEGETLTAVFELRDLPPEMTFNREAMPRDEIYYEYFWAVYVYLDAAHEDEDFSVDTYYAVAQDTPEFTGKLEDHVKVFVGERVDESRTARIDTLCSIEVDTENNTLVLRADIPGITEAARVSFQTLGFLAENRADVPD